MNKVCKRCGQPLPDGWNFYNNKRTGKLTKWTPGQCCRPCYNAINVERRHKKRDAYKSNPQVEAKATCKEPIPPKRYDNIDNCYIYLAACIVRTTMAEYERALKKYNNTPESLHYIERLEGDLLSYYYSILVLQSLDLRRYCINKRKAYGIGVYTTAQDVV